MILTSQEICSNSMIGKEAPMQTRKEVELNSMMVSSFTHPDMMQRIVGDGVKGVCPGRWINKLMNVYGILNLFMVNVMQDRQRMAAAIQQIDPVCQFLVGE